MRLWNTSSLDADLVEDKVSSEERFKCFALIFFLWTIIDEVGSFIGPIQASPPAITTSILSVLITIAGTIWAYRVNRLGDGKGFLDRLVCLSVPIGVKFTVLTMALLIPMNVIKKATGQSTDWRETSWLECVVFTSLTILFFWRLTYHIDRVARGAVVKPSPTTEGAADFRPSPTSVV